jgi:uncharacterized membrane protein
MFNLVTATYFLAAGASVFTARLVSLTFAALSILLVYTTAKTCYNSKVGLLSAAFFAVMPGIVWLSGLAMIETMLIFAVTLALFSFFRWLQAKEIKFLVVGLVALALGAIVKYQTLVIVPLTVLIFLLLSRKSDALKVQLGKLRPKLVWIGVALTVAAVGLLGVLSMLGLLDDWVYAIQVGNVGQSEYSLRFPAFIYYFLEMVWPYSDMHPVSLLLYGLGLAGLAFLAYRRRPEDKFLLIWFFVTYIVFSFIPNRQWRYVTLVFPVLAISAAELAASVYGKAQKTWQLTQNSANRKLVAKASAIILIAFTAGGLFYSAADAYIWLNEDRISVPTEAATAYIVAQPSTNGSILVLCPFNRFNRDMVWFYLNSKADTPTSVYQYPMQAVDAYPVDFNITQLVNYCQTNGTKYVLLYEYEATPTYYGSSLNEQAIYNLLNETGRFSLEASFGVAPRRMFVYCFNTTTDLS